MIALMGLVDGWRTYVVVAEEVDVAWMIVGWSSGVGEVNQSVLSGELLSCAWVSGKSCARRTEFENV